MQDIKYALHMHGNGMRVGLACLLMDAPGVSESFMQIVHMSGPDKSQHHNMDSSMSQFQVIVKVT